MNKSLFQELINPIKKDEFFKDYYNKNILFLKNKNFFSFFSYEKLNDILNNLDTNKISLFLGKNNLDSNDNPLELIRLSKYNINLNSIENFNLELEKTIKKLEIELIKDIKVNVYFSHKYEKYKIADKYFQNNNSILLQLDGESIFHISKKSTKLENQTKEFYYYEYNNEIFDKWNESNNTLNKELNIKYENQKILMEKGSLLYIPKGLYIDFTTVTDISFHIEILLREVKFIDFFIWLYQDFIKEKLKSYNFKLSVFQEKKHFENIKKEIISNISTLIKENDMLTYYFSKWLENKYSPYSINLPLNYNVKYNYELLINKIINNYKFYCIYNKFFFIEKNDIIEIVLCSQRVLIKKDDINLIKYLLSGNKFTLLEISSIFNKYNNMYLINIICNLLSRNILFFENDEQ